MAKITWRFSVRSSQPEIGVTGTLQGNSIGLELPTHDEVRRLAVDAGFETKGWIKKEENRENARIEVLEPADSPRMARILALIEEKYGFRANPNGVFDMSRSRELFGVQRVRKYSRSEMDGAEYLSFGMVRFIAHAAFRDQQQFAADSYVVRDFRKSAKTNLMGCLSPFHAIALNGDMKNRLEAYGLVGANFNDEVGGSCGELWKFGSSIVLPRCLTRLVNGQGRDVDHPDDWRIHTEQLYDDGCRPVSIRYMRCDFQAIGRFDVAMQREFVGNHQAGAYRGCLVSQRFRRILKDLGIRGTHYVPVALE